MMQHRWKISILAFSLSITLACCGQPSVSDPSRDSVDVNFLCDSPQVDECLTASECARPPCATLPDNVAGQSALFCSAAGFCQVGSPCRGMADNLYCMKVPSAVDLAGRPTISGVAVELTECAGNGDCEAGEKCVGVSVYELISVGRAGEPPSGEIYYACFGRCFPAGAGAPEVCQAGEIVDRASETGTSEGSTTTDTTD